METVNKSKEALAHELEVLREAFDALNHVYKRDKAVRQKTELLLNERVKELNCHNRISVIMSNQDISIDEILKNVVSIVPDGWQFPEITGSFIQISGETYQSDRYAKDGWILSKELKISEEKIGRIEVSYQKNKLLGADYPFLEEEDELLFSIAERLSNFITRSRTIISLKESELKFRNLIEGINDVIFELDKQGNILYISPSIEKLLGFSQEDIIGQHFQYFIGDNAESQGQIFFTLAHTGEIINDYCILAKTGEPHWIRLSTKAIYKNGLFAGGNGTLVDITEKKQVELELQKSEALYRSILQASPDVITITDISGKIRFSSPKVVEMFGLTHPEEAYNQTLFDYILPDDQVKAARNISKMLNGEFSGAEEYTGVRKDGSTFDIDVNGELIRGTDGEPTGLIFVTRDISERKQTEEKLKKNEENFRFLVETVNDAIYEVDIHGIINYVSPAIEKILGFKSAELIGTNFFTHMHPDDVPILMKALSELGEVDSSHLEYRYMTKDGETRWVSSSTSPIRKNGVIVGGTGLLTNINDRKLAENEIRKLYRAVEQSPVSIVITNLEGDIEYANPKVMETTGYSMEELLGKNPRILKSGETAPIEYDSLWNSVTSGKNWNGIFHNKRKDGTFYWESSTISPILDQQGKITHYLAVKEDITEWKKNEEALRRSEERFSQLAEQSQTVIWEVDAEGLYTFVCEMSLPVWGYRPEELIGKKHFYDLHPAESRSAYKDQVLLSFASKERFKNITNQIVAKNGELKWVLTNGIPILDASDSPVGYRGADNDITDKKLKDNELKKLSLAVEQSPVSIVITDLHARIEYVNPAFEVTTLFKADEVIGHSAKISKSGETPDEVYKEMWETITAGHQWQSEWVNKKKNGELYWENVLITPIFDEQNIITNYLAVKQDISKRKEVEKEILNLNANLELKIQERTNEIRLSEEKFSTAFQFNAAMMAISDFENGVYIDVNKTFEESLGFSREELIGKTNKELQLFVDPELRNQLLWNLGHNIPVRKQEVLMRTKEGTIKMGLLSANQIFIGAKKCFLTATMDITDRKKMEDQLIKARNEADLANQAKSEFLSRMSHELRTPMNSILGFAQLLDLGELSHEQRKGVGHIRKSGKHLLDLINEVLDISRIEAGRLELSLEPVQLSIIIEEAIDIVHLQAQGKDLIIEVKDSPVNQLFVLSDRQRLKQVLLNLLSNAIKYNIQGGSVTIFTELKKEVGSEDENLRISIADKGFGIAPEDIERLFVPFERVGAERTAAEGTGLGLAVVRKLIDAMGGRLGVESAPGEGSTFWIELPLSESPMEKLNKSADLQNLGKRHEGGEGSILYIEDNLSNIELIAQILAEMRTNIRLVTLMQGKPAFETVLIQKPDLVLLDLNLPDIHGEEVLLQLKSSEKTRDIPVVIISADATRHQMDKLLRIGAVNYLAKPLDLNELLRVVDTYIKLRDN